MGHHRQVHDKRKASVGMYSGCDYPTNLVFVYIDPAIPTSSFNYIVFYACNIIYHSSEGHVNMNTHYY